MTHNNKNTPHTTPTRTDQTMTNPAPENGSNTGPAISQQARMMQQQEHAALAAFEAAIGAHAQATQRTALPVGVSARLQAITLMPQMLGEDEALDSERRTPTHAAAYSDRQRGHLTALEDALAQEAHAYALSAQSAGIEPAAEQPLSEQSAAENLAAHLPVSEATAAVPPARSKASAIQPNRPDTVSQLLALAARLLPGPSLWQFAGQGTMAAAVFMVGFYMSTPELSLSQAANQPANQPTVLLTFSTQDDERFDLSAFYLDDFSDPQADGDTAGYAALFEEE